MKIIFFLLLILSLSVFGQENNFVKEIDIHSANNKQLKELSNYCDSTILKKEGLTKAEYQYLSEINKFLKIDSINYRILVLIAEYYYYNEDYTNVVRILKKAIFLSDKNKYTLYFYNINNTIGVSYYQLGKYDLALDYYYKALKFSSENNIIKAKFDVYQNIGLLFLKLEDYKKSNYYYTKAYELRDSINDNNFIAGLLINMASMFTYYNNQVDTSLKYNEQALVYYKKADNFVGISSVYNNIGDIYESKKEYEKALYYYKKSNTNFIKINYKYGICVTYYNIGSIHFLQESYSKSLKYLHLSLKYADSLKNIEMQRDIYKKLSDILYIKTNYKKAIDNYKIYIQLKDSIINNEKLTKLRNLEQKHKKLKTEEEIAKLKEARIIEQLSLLKKKDELSKQRYVTIIFVLLSIILVSIIFFIFNRYKRLNISFLTKEKEIKNTQNYLKTSEARFKILFEESPDAIFVENAEGIILDVNNATSKLYKKTKEQIIGKNIKDLSPSIEKDNIITDLNYWINRKEKTFRSYAHLDNGDKIPIDIKFSVIDFDGEKAGLFIVRDISKQIEIEEKLRAEKIKFIKADTMSFS